MLVDKPFQQNVRFAKENDYCELTLYLNSSTYTGKMIVVRKTSESVEQVVKVICEDSLIPDTIDFHPHSEASRLLHNHVASVAKELDITITDIRQESYHDIYYFKTNASAALITFYYNNKGFYTTAVPMSANGEQDSKLKQLCENL